MVRTALCLLLLAFGSSVFASPKPNLLVITVDDMSCDSVGVFGCKLSDITPNIDRLAAQSLRFNYAHTVVGNCMPSRNVMWSGKYPHNNRIEGFHSISKEEKDYPVLGDLVKAAGWFTGIRHKVSHSTPYAPFPWDIVLGEERRDDVKNAASWGDSARRGFEAAKSAGKPFCLMLNIADPHKPFYAEGKRGATVPDKKVPTRVFTPEEVPVPGFLPDDPVIRKELSQYYSTVRRADDAVGSVLEALKSSGQADKTIIVFLSDHGMPLPFAKTQLYHHSTRTPLMISWPGVTKPGAIDEAHMVSTVDLLPTLLDMLGIEKPGGFDGSSFVQVLKGEPEPERLMVFKEHNENAGGQNTPMRAVQTKDWLYVFSPWSNGKRVMGGATAGTLTCRQMRVLAKTDAKVAERIDLFDHRKPEEAYEVRYDPDALSNLIDSPAHQSQVAMLEKAMEDWMVRTHDPLLEVFRRRDDAAFREAFVTQKEAGTKSRKKNKAAAKGKAEPKSTATKHKNLIELAIPDSVALGQNSTVTLKYNLPAELGERPVQATLKSGGNERLERKTLMLSGAGEKEVVFQIPAQVPGDKVIFAGLVGNSIKDALQHLQTKAVPAK